MPSAATRLRRPGIRSGCIGRERRKREGSFRCSRPLRPPARPGALLGRVDGRPGHRAGRARARLRRRSCTRPELDPKKRATADCRARRVGNYFRLGLLRRLLEVVLGNGSGVQRPTCSAGEWRRRDRLLCHNDLDGTSRDARRRIACRRQRRNGVLSRRRLRRRLCLNTRGWCRRSRGELDARDLGDDGCRLGHRGVDL